MMFYWYILLDYDWRIGLMKNHCGQKNWRLVMPVKFWHSSLRFWFFLSYLITYYYTYRVLHGKVHNLNLLWWIKKCKSDFFEGGFEILRLDIFRYYNAYCAPSIGQDVSHPKLKKIWYFFVNFGGVILNFLSSYPV